MNKNKDNSNSLNITRHIAKHANDEVGVVHLLKNDLENKIERQAISRDDFNKENRIENSQVEKRNVTETKPIETKRLNIENNTSSEPLEKQNYKPSDFNRAVENSANKPIYEERKNIEKKDKLEFPKNFKIDFEKFTEAFDKKIDEILEKKNNTKFENNLESQIANEENFYEGKNDEIVDKREDNFALKDFKNDDDEKENNENTNFATSIENNEVETKSGLEEKNSQEEIKDRKKYVFENTHEKKEDFKLKYQSAEITTEKSEETFVLLVDKDKGQTFLEGFVSQRDGVPAFREFHSSSYHEIDLTKFYNLAGTNADNVANLIDKDQAKIDKGLDKTIIKTLETVYGKDTVERVLDNADRIYLHKYFTENNAKGKIEYMNTFGGIEYMLSALNEKYEVKIDGQTVKRRSLLEQLSAANNLDVELDKFEVKERVSAIEKSDNISPKIESTVLDSRTNPELLKDKVLFLSNAEHFEHSGQYKDENLALRFFNAMGTRRFDPVNVIAGFVSALVISTKGFSLSESFRIAYRMYPPMAGSNQSLGLLWTLKGHNERKEIWDAIDDYNKTRDAFGRDFEKRDEFFETVIGRRLDIPNDVKDLDKSIALLNVEVRDDKRLDIKVGTDVDKSEASIRLDKTDNDKVEIKSIEISTLDKDGQDVKARLEVKDGKYESKTENKSDLKEKVDRKEKLESIPKLENKSKKIEKGSLKGKDKLELKEIVEATKGSLEKGNIKDIKESLDKNDLHIEKVVTTKDVENKDDDKTDRLDVIDAEVVKEVDVTEKTVEDKDDVKEMLGTNIEVTDDERKEYEERDKEENEEKTENNLEKHESIFDIDENDPEYQELNDVEPHEGNFFEGIDDKDILGYGYSDEELDDFHF